MYLLESFTFLFSRDVVPAFNSLDLNNKIDLFAMAFLFIFSSILLQKEKFPLMIFTYQTSIVVFPVAISVSLYDSGLKLIGNITGHSWMIVFSLLSIAIYALHVFARIKKLTTDHSIF